MCGGYQGSLPRLPELYPTIRCPTLVLWGERDRHFPPVHARDLHQAIPGSRLALVPAGEHWMAWHAAAAVASRFLEWA
jgi:pimeloyl-ACP methyl ester carboxylesterase